MFVKLTVARTNRMKENKHPQRHIWVNLALIQHMEEIPGTTLRDALEARTELYPVGATHQDGFGVTETPQEIMALALKREVQTA